MCGRRECGRGRDESQTDSGSGGWSRVGKQREET